MRKYITWVAFKFKKGNLEERKNNYFKSDKTLFFFNNE